MLLLVTFCEAYVHRISKFKFERKHPKVNKIVQKTLLPVLAVPPTLSIYFIIINLDSNLDSLQNSSYKDVQVPYSVSYTIIDIIIVSTSIDILGPEHKIEQLNIAIHSFSSLRISPDIFLSHLITLRAICHCSKHLFKMIFERLLTSRKKSERRQKQSDFICKRIGWLVINQCLWWQWRQQLSALQTPRRPIGRKILILACNDNFRCLLPVIALIAAAAEVSASDWVS